MPFISSSMLRDISRYAASAKGTFISAKGTLNHYYRSPVTFRTPYRHPAVEPITPPKEPLRNTQDTVPRESNRERTTGRSWPTEHVPGKKNPEVPVSTHILTAIGGTYEKIREIDQAIKVTHEKIGEVYKAIGGTHGRMEEIEKAIGGTHERVEEVEKAIGGIRGGSHETIGEIHKAIRSTQERIEEIGKVVGGIHGENEGIGDIREEIKYLKDKYGRIDGRLRSMQWQLGALLGVLSVFFGLTGYKITRAIDVEKDSPVKNETR